MRFFRRMAALSCTQKLCNSACSELTRQVSNWHANKLCNILMLCAQSSGQLRFLGLSRKPSANLLESSIGRVRWCGWAEGLAQSTATVHGVPAGASRTHPAGKGRKRGKFQYSSVIQRHWKRKTEVSGIVFSQDPTKRLKQKTKQHALSA